MGVDSFVGYTLHTRLVSMVTTNSIKKGGKVLFWSQLFYDIAIDSALMLLCLGILQNFLLQVNWPTYVHVPRTLVA